MTLITSSLLLLPPFPPHFIILFPHSPTRRSGFPYWELTLCRLIICDKDSSTPPNTPITPTAFSTPMTTSSLKELRLSIARAEAYVDEIGTQIEERDRLIGVLKLTPSANDNVDLINHLSKTLKLLSYIHSDLDDYHDSNGSSSSLGQLVDRFNGAVSSYNATIYSDNLVSDPYINISEYKFTQPDLDFSTPSEALSRKADAVSVKSVRFKDAVESDEEHTEWRNQLMGTAGKFKPYTDDAEEANSDANTLSSINTSNEQMFAEHQQQLLAQDQSLDELHRSINIQRSMGTTINEELDDHLIILSDLERGVEYSADRLQHALRRLRSFSAKVKENGSLATIVILTVILILLLVVLN